MRPVEWTALKPESVNARGKAPVEILGDHSFMAQGNNPTGQTLQQYYENTIVRAISPISPRSTDVGRTTRARPEPI